MRIFLYVIAVAAFACLLSGCGRSEDPVMPKAKEKGPVDVKPIGIQPPDQKKDGGGGPKIVTD